VQHVAYTPRQLKTATLARGESARDSGKLAVMTTGEQVSTVAASPILCVTWSTSPEHRNPFLLVAYGGRFRAKSRVHHSCAAARVKQSSLRCFMIGRLRASVARLNGLKAAVKTADSMLAHQFKLGFAIMHFVL